MILNKTIKIGALFTALILMLTGCSINNKTLEKSQKNEDVLVTLILDKGGVNDGSFNESAWSCLLYTSWDFFPLDIFVISLKL